MASFTDSQIDLQLIAMLSDGRPPPPCQVQREGCSPCLPPSCNTWRQTASADLILHNRGSDSQWDRPMVGLRRIKA